MKKYIYSGNTILSNYSVSDIVEASTSESYFNELFSLITVEYFDGIKMDCDSSKWLGHGYTILTTCKDLKITVKLKNK